MHQVKSSKIYFNVRRIIEITNANEKDRRKNESAETRIHAMRIVVVNEFYDVIGRFVGCPKIEEFTERKNIIFL